MSRAGLLVVAAALVTATALSIRDLSPTALDHSREVAANVLLFVPALMLAEFIAMRPRPAAIRRAEGPYFTFLSLGLVAPILSSVVLVGAMSPVDIAEVLMVAAAGVATLALIALLATSTVVLRWSRILLTQVHLRKHNLEYEKGAR